MPLIKCPDCGTEVSDLAAACPKCARPHQSGWRGQTRGGGARRGGIRRPSRHVQESSGPVYSSLPNASHPDPGLVFMPAFPPAPSSQPFSSSWRSSASSAGGFKVTQSASRSPTSGPLFGVASCRSLPMRCATAISATCRSRSRSSSASSASVALPSPAPRSMRSR